MELTTKSGWDQYLPKDRTTSGPTHCGCTCWRCRHFRTTGTGDNHRFFRSNTYYSRTCVSSVLYSNMLWSESLRIQQSKSPKFGYLSMMVVSTLGEEWFH
jgi:hypothetical protein